MLARVSASEFKSFDKMEIASQCQKTGKNATCDDEKEMRNVLTLKT